MRADRPSLATPPTRIPYNTNFNLTVTLPQTLVGAELAVNLLDHGFQTHGTSQSMRHVGLVIKSQTVAGNNTVNLMVTAPPNSAVWPNGPGFLFVLANGVPSTGRKMIMGTGIITRN